MARYRASGNAHLIGTAVHHPRVLVGADVAGQHVSDPPRQVGVAGHLGVAGQSHLARRAAQPRTGDLELGGAQVDQTALAAVPAHCSGRPARVLGPGDRFGRHHQQLFNELSRQSAQQVLDRQLRLPDHTKKRQCRLRVGLQERLRIQRRPALVHDMQLHGLLLASKLLHGG